MDTASLKAVKLITEEAESVRVTEAVNDMGGKTLFLEGVYSTHTVENRNGRRYKKELLERELGKIAPKIRERKLFGELSHPSRNDIDLERAAILIEDVAWNQSDLMGKSSILDTPIGNIVAACLKRGVVGISSRGLGTVSESGWVNDDYQLITWDVVSDPSNQKSWVKGICESKIYYVNESGNVVREESVLTDSQKTEAIADALQDSEGKIKEMAEAAVEERLREANSLLADAQAEIIRLSQAAPLLREAHAEIARLRQGNELMKEALEEIYKLREMLGISPEINNAITEEKAKKVYVSILKEELRKSLQSLL